jgi:hypothetical protein
LPSTLPCVDASNAMQVRHARRAIRMTDDLCRQRNYPTSCHTVH